MTPEIPRQQTQAGPCAESRLLAFDAAGSSCSAAVFAGGRLRARRFEAMRRGQAERLVPMIEAVLEEAGLRYGDLEGLAVTCGPGGFTGVRLGLATARGLALALARPLIGVTSFEAFAAGVPEDDRADARRSSALLLVAIEAKRADLYVQCFEPDLQPISEPAARLPEALPALLSEAGLGARPILVVGDAAARAAKALSADGCNVEACLETDCDAAVVGQLALAKPWPAVDASPPRPLYLRPADAKPMAASSTPALP